MGALARAPRRAGRKRPTRRSQGHIEELHTKHGTSYRVKVYAGVDVLLDRKLYLTHTVPSGPDAHAIAEQKKYALLERLATGDHARTDANVPAIVDRYLSSIEEQPVQHRKCGRKTLATYRGYLNKHIDTLLKTFRARDGLDPDVLDDFYGVLARCRDHQDCSTKIRHWTESPHSCDKRCTRHVCNPLAPTTLRKIHWILNGAYKMAVRRKWLLTNPMIHAELPPAPPPNPKPPTADEVARIIDATWHGTDYGPMVWTASVTGARLGELCALRWSDLIIDHVDLSHIADRTTPHECLDAGCTFTLSIQRSIEHLGLQIYETDTKTHQHRRVTLEDVTAEALIDLLDTRRRDARLAGIEHLPEHFMFHHRKGPEHCLRPGAVSTHYSRLVNKLGIATTFHKLRHYSVTELILSGLDIRTIAGRHGHAGGGTTTLKYYAAWTSEADQRAADAIVDRIPTRPATARAGGNTAPRRTKAEIVADRLRTQIIEGAFTSLPLPTMKQIATSERVSINAAHAAVGLLAREGYISVSRGKRATATDPTEWPAQTVSEPTPPSTSEAATPSPDERDLAAVVGRIGATPAPGGSVPRSHVEGNQLLEVRILCDRQHVTTLTVDSDPADPIAMREVVRSVALNIATSDHYSGEILLQVTTFLNEQEIMTVLLGRKEELSTRYRPTG